MLIISFTDVSSAEPDTNDTSLLASPVAAAGARAGAGVSVEVEVVEEGTARGALGATTGTGAWAGVSRTEEALGAGADVEATGAAGTAAAGLGAFATITTQNCGREIGSVGRCEEMVSSSSRERGLGRTYVLLLEVYSSNCLVISENLS